MAPTGGEAEAAAVDFDYGFADCQSHARAKYSPADAPIRITVEVKDNDQMLTINIADRGPGIDDFEQSLVFEKFYRGRNQRVQVHGTGMGLAICKAIVEVHGGRLGLTSQLGHGSVFYFSLPLG